MNRLKATSDKQTGIAIRLLLAKNIAFKLVPTYDTHGKVICYFDVEVDHDVWIELEKVYLTLIH